MTLDLNLILLTIMLLCAVWAVMTRSLLMSAIGLAAVSIVLTLLMFNLDSPLAAVFELSVCAGLITVVFVSTISLTKPITRPELKQQTKHRIKRYWYLPVIIVGLFVFLGFYMVYPELNNTLNLYPQGDVKNVLWGMRTTDIIGQMIILLAGVFGVVVLFKERAKDDE
ncbi:MAG: NADH-quinone oxidoreductase subunit J [Pseudomonadota bacterium]